MGALARSLRGGESWMYLTTASWLGRDGTPQEQRYPHAPSKAGRWAVGGSCGGSFSARQNSRRTLPPPCSSWRRPSTGAADRSLTAASPPAHDERKDGPCVARPRLLLSPYIRLCRTWLLSWTTLIAPISTRGCRACARWRWLISPWSKIRKRYLAPPTTTSSALRHKATSRWYRTTGRASAGRRVWERLGRSSRR
jgi:hypothetical protein